jgi:hypothetical protein
MARYRQSSNWVRVEVQVPESGREEIKNLAEKLRTQHKRKSKKTK